MVIADRFLRHRYDAVTTEGILQWQDTLDDLNRPYFEAADGIFINYTWKEDTPHQAAAVAGARRHDVYMGVDVFGRNTYGGGGMTCDVALTAAKSAGSYPPPVSLDACMLPIMSPVLTMTGNCIPQHHPEVQLNYILHAVMFGAVNSLVALHVTVAVNPKVMIVGGSSGSSKAPRVAHGNEL